MPSRSFVNRTSPDEVYTEVGMGRVTRLSEVLASGENQLSNWTYTGQVVLVELKDSPTVDEVKVGSLIADRDRGAVPVEMNCS